MNALFKKYATTIQEKEPMNLIGEDPWESLEGKGANNVIISKSQKRLKHYFNELDTKVEMSQEI